MAKDDNRRSNYQSKAKKLRQLLEEKRFDSLGEFLVDANSTMSHYLDIIRAILRRPTLVFKHNMKEIYTNTFHPWISGVLNSNTDLQFILEEYGCASYA
jgi:hypothetical protein